MWVIHFHQGLEILFAKKRKKEKSQKKHKLIPLGSCSPSLKVLTVYISCKKTHKKKLRHVMKNDMQTFGTSVFSFVSNANRVEIRGGEIYHQLR